MHPILLCAVAFHHDAVKTGIIDFIGLHGVASGSVGQLDAVTAIWNYGVSITDKTAVNDAIAGLHIDAILRHTQNRVLLNIVK